MLAGGSRRYRSWSRFLIRDNTLSVVLFAKRTQAIDRTCQMEPGPGHYKLAIVNPQEDNAPKVCDFQ